MFRSLKGHINYIYINFRKIIKDSSFRNDLISKIKIKLKFFFYSLILHLIDLCVIAPTIFFINFIKLSRERKGTVLLGNRYGNLNKSVMSDDYKAIFRTLKSLNYDFDNYFFDLGSGYFSKFKIILKIILRYDLVILSSNNELDPRCLTNYQIKKIIKNFNIKLIYLLWDTTDKKFLKSKKNISLHNLNVVLDNPEFSNFHNYRINNLLFKFPILDYDYVTKKYNLNFEKRIDTCFIGQISSHRDYRKDLLNKLSNKMNIFISNKNRNEFLPDEEYYRTLSSSKITINFSQGIDSEQIKGRVFEAIFFECLVLDYQNSLITKFFEPNKELIMFKNEDDCLEKIQFYLKNEEIRKEICVNAKNKLLKNFSPKHFWKDIIY